MENKTNRLEEELIERQIGIEEELEHLKEKMIDVLISNNEALRKCNEDLRNINKLTMQNTKIIILLVYGIVIFTLITFYGLYIFC